MFSLGVLSIAAGGLAAAIVLLPTGEKPDRQPSRAAPLAAQSPPAAEPPATHLSAAEHDRLISSVSLFITSAVARHHPERSWAVVHPILRQGLTKQQWSTGNIPVVPYPAVGVDLVKLDSVIGRTALVEVMLEPNRGTRLVRKTFLAEVRRSPQAPYGWAVSSWVPEGVSEAQMQLNAPHPAARAIAYHAKHLSGMWILVPVIVLLGGLLLVPIGLFVREAVRFRRAEAQFRASLHDRYGERDRYGEKA